MAATTKQRFNPKDVSIPKLPQRSKDIEIASSPHSKRGVVVEIVKSNSCGLLSLLYLTDRCARLEKLKALFFFNFNEISAEFKENWILLEFFFSKRVTMSQAEMKEIIRKQILNPLNSFKGLFKDFLQLLDYKPTLIKALFTKLGWMHMKNKIY
uniref:Uncharacterized protein n=2 Tax=Nicotiana TaxID=4085 RepID=A0A1S4ALI6_TOBAC|nr:PREDICTED: uncharacterized protein LOC104223210 [Nicotiana sylvestris]XP_016477531.1 PREDICTED: uncharacterized protein LOC107798993 [Nicotiana tabacum]